MCIYIYICVYIYICIYRYIYISIYVCVYIYMTLVKVLRGFFSSDLFESLSWRWLKKKPLQRLKHWTLSRNQWIG